MYVLLAFLMYVYMNSFIYDERWFLQHLTRNEGTDEEVSRYQEAPYTEGNLNPMSSKSNKTF